MLNLHSAAALGELRLALEAAGFTELELRRRVATPAAQPVNATRYYPEGFPHHDTPLDDLIRLLMIGARVHASRVIAAIGEAATGTLCEAALVDREGDHLRARVTLSLWHGLYFVSDREDRLTQIDYVMPPEAPAVWMTELIAKHTSAAPQRVLDIGTGCGVLALLAAPRAGGVLGVDSNVRAVEFARFNAALNGFTHCTFTHARCQDLTAGVGRFDRITFNCPGVYEVGCLQPEAFSCADGDELLDAVYALLPQVLAPDGVAILRHELPAHSRPRGGGRLRVEQASVPHYAGLADLRTVCAIVKPA